MHVYGCSSELDVEKVDLPAREVAEIGIDLLRLDLCDPDPIVLTVKGQRLRFSRMQQFEFAYPLSDDMHVLGVHGSGGGHCLEGRQELDYCDTQLLMKRFTRTRESFAHHLGEYLFRVFESESVQPIWWSGRNQVTYRNHQLSYASRFCRNARVLASCLKPRLEGEMFQIIERGSGRWPQRVAWLFDRLRDRKPTVFGTAVYQSFLGIPVEKVDFCLGSACLINDLEKTIGVPVEPVGSVAHFRMNGITYSWYPEIARNGKHSLTMMHATESQIWSSRIAMHDLAKKRTRKLTADRALFWGNSTGTGWPAGTAHLRGRGVKLMPDVTSENYACLSGHCDPLVSVYTEGLLRASSFRWESTLRTLSAEQFVGLVGNFSNERCWAECGCRPQEINDLLSDLSEQARREFAAGLRVAPCFTVADLRSVLLARFASRDFGCGFTISEILEKLDQGMLPTLMGFIFGRVSKRVRAGRVDALPSIISSLSSKEKRGIRQRLIDGEGFCVHCATKLFDEKYLCTS